MFTKIGLHDTYDSLRESYNQMVDEVSEILQRLDGIASGATNNSPSTTIPKVAETASVGTEDNYARGDHVHPAQTSVSGNAGTATKLETARTIGINGGATGTATNFDGSDDINIPITGVKEAYLEWGGRNYTNAYGPIDATLVPALGANRLAFMLSAGIEIQYSTNNGSSWETYNVDNIEKQKLFTDIGTTLYIGANSSTGIDKSTYQLRIIITTDTVGLYTALNKFVIYCHTGGSSGCWCTIDGKTQANVSSGTDTWDTFANKISIAGASGYNVINTPDFTTYGNSSYPNHYQKLRFTFGITSHNTTYPGLRITSIMGFGGMGWGSPSTMAKTGRIYTYDANKNVTFPANVTATSFSGNASSATKATQDSAGQQINSTYVKGISISGRTVTITKGDGSTSTVTTQDTNTTYGEVSEAANGLATPALLATANGAVPKSGTTMTGPLVGQANNEYTTPQFRNITMSNAEPVGGSNGQIHFQYS